MPGDDDRGLEVQRTACSRLQVKRVRETRQWKVCYRQVWINHEQHGWAERKHYVTCRPLEQQCRAQIKMPVLLFIATGRVGSVPVPIMIVSLGQHAPLKVITTRYYSTDPKDRIFH